MHLTLPDGSQNCIQLVGRYRYVRIRTPKIHVVFRGRMATQARRCLEHLGIAATTTTWARRERPPSATSTVSLLAGHFRFIGCRHPVVTWRVSIGAAELLSTKRRRPTGTWGVLVSIASVTVPVTTCVRSVRVGRRRGTGGATCVLATSVVR